MLVEGAMTGQHQSPFKGSSVEFVEHRQYSQGDEIRHIDWRAYGKTGRYYIKEFEEETNLQAYLIVDASGSMAYGESTATKFEYARVLAGSLGYLLTTQRDAVGLVTFDNQIRDRLEPSTHPKGFQQIASLLTERTPGKETGMGPMFHRLIPTLRRRSLVILISDLFDDPATLQTTLQQFRRHRHDVVLIQVVAPEEVEFPFDKPTQFRNLELPEDRILVDPHRLRKLYLEQFQAFQQQLRDIAARNSYDLLQVTTAEPFQLVLGRYLTSRKQGKRT